MNGLIRNESFVLGQTRARAVGKFSKVFLPQVFQDCGQPRLGKRQAGLGFGYQHLVSSAVDRHSGHGAGGGAGAGLDHLVTDIISRVKETRGFWTRLPDILCQNPEVGTGKEPQQQNCWTGRDRGTYTARRAGDGLAAQEQNPEVEVDTSRPDTEVNEQIFSLKLASNKLENAYNGHSVEWPHYEPSKFTSLTADSFLIKLLRCAKDMRLGLLSLL